MENVGKKRFENFPPATLYIDDLSEIVEILAQACKQIEVKTGDYKITDPAELKALASKFPTGRFDDIYLEGYGPYICIDIRTSGISAYISENTFEQQGIIAKIRDIISRNKKKKLNQGWLFSTLSIISVVIATWQILSKEYLIGTLFIFLSIASFFSSVRYAFKNTIIVHTQIRGTVKTFFERKKDDIVLAFISATLGGLVRYLITKLMQ